MKKKLLIEILLHLAFWIITTYFFVNNSFLRFHSRNIYEEYYSLLLIVIIIYFNYLFLISRFFKQNKFLQYFLLLFLSVSSISIIEFKYIQDDILFSTSMADDNFKKGMLLWNFIYIFFRDTLFVGFFTMFKIYQDAVKSYKLLQKNAELEKQYFLSQMDTIKSKVNTHFFFNTLDCIYSLIITKSSKAPETVLNLSDLMRYVVGESDKKWVTLEKEISFIQNYIELEKIKDSSTNLNLEITGNTNEYEVPPMIFECFVNNAFKYTDFRNNGFVSIKITCESGIIIFNCKNSINYDESGKKIKSTKKGLINTRNRLNLIYNENYKLDIKDDNGFFTVNLMLKKQSLKIRDIESSD